MTNQYLDTLRQKASQLPQTPGVYLHKDEKGNVLYVGKAKSLKNRVVTYFQNSIHQTTKTSALVAKVADFEIIQTDSEAECLILEDNLIKSYRPPYNILLRDDKTYPYLKLTLAESWPRLVLTRRTKPGDGNLYFGPFAHGGVLHQILEVIQKQFPLVRCTPNVLTTIKRPCMYYHLKKCLGPCHMEVEKKVYDELITHVTRVLEGKVEGVIDHLQSKMMECSLRLEFEEAANFRDQIASLKELKNKQSMVFQADLNGSILAYCFKNSYLSSFLGTIREGKFLGGKSYFFQDTFIEDSGQIPEYLESVMVQSPLLNSNSHKVIVVGNLPELTPPEFKFFKERMLVTKEDIKLHLKKNSLDKVQQKSFWDLLQLCDSNAQNALDNGLNLKKQSRVRLESVQDFLGLDHLPRNIECFDVSNFQGSQNVASCVSFIDAVANKKGYRIFKIKSFEGQNDFGSLREVMNRRFNPAKETEYPDLVLIDGGEPQVREVVLTLNRMGLSRLPVRGIAKSRNESNFTQSKVNSSKERIITPTLQVSEEKIWVEFKTTELKVGSLSYQLLCTLRDEAHRFAITAHKRSRDKSTLKSGWDSLMGIGKKRKKILMSEFHTLENLNQFTNEEIHLKTGIGLKIIEKMRSSNKVK
jgi:excinuclease ABC subunit C